MTGDNVLLYENLAAPIFSRKELQERLDQLEFHFATGLIVENLQTACDLCPNAVRTFYSREPQDQRFAVRELLKSSMRFSDGVMNSVFSSPREKFCRVSSKNFANWCDTNVIDGDCTIESVWLIAFILEGLKIRPGQDVLLLGSGSGYTATLAAMLSYPGGSVVSVERSPLILKDARDRIDSLEFDCGLSEIKHVEANALEVEVAARSFDAIWPSLAISRMPSQWIESLKPDGRIVQFGHGGEQPGGDVVIWTSKGGVLTESARLRGIENVSFGEAESGEVEIFSQYQSLEDQFGARLRELISDPG